MTTAASDSAFRNFAVSAVKLTVLLNEYPGRNGRAICAV